MSVHVSVDAGLNSDLVGIATDEPTFIADCRSLKKRWFPSGDGSQNSKTSASPSGAVLES